MASLKFEGIKVARGAVSHKQGSGPLAGATARVETSGDIDRRITATRLILTGPFALGLRKKKDKRQLYLSVEGEGYGILLELDPKNEKAARKFASQFNAQASVPVSERAAPIATPAPAPAPAAVPASAPAAPPPPVDKVAKLTELAQLRDSGAIDESEFAAMKAEILGVPAPPPPPPAPVSHDHLPPPPGSTF